MATTSVPYMRVREFAKQFQFQEITVLYDENGINLIFRENLNAAKCWENFFHSNSSLYTAPE